jgi:Tfp pilus assembly protein PilV
MKIRKIRSEDGFSILEVMVGLIIFSMGLLLLMSMMVVSIDGNQWAEDTTQSVQLIKEKVEQLKNTRMSQLQSGEDAVGDYARSWDVWAISSNLVGVTVRVKWADADLKEYACSTVTYMQPKQ